MERSAFRLNGFAVLVGALVLIGVGVALAANAQHTPALAVAAAVVWLAAAIVLSGFTVVNPNEGKVVQFFGRYVGSVRAAGFFWVVPLSTKRRISLRVRNFETQKLKVNDANGNPVEIATVVVYNVVDTAKAAFSVDDYEAYVAIQSEAAVRHLATSYPYDAHDSGQSSLRDGGEVTERLTIELRERTELAGVEVRETRITHLAYAPEIAQAMLVRQQAAQVVAARTTIVEGAVGMVGLALGRLQEQGMVELDEDRKAAMVSNLLVVLCGDRATQPVINTGTIYG